MENFLHPTPAINFSRIFQPPVYSNPIKTFYSIYRKPNIKAQAHNLI